MSAAGWILYVAGRIGGRHADSFVPFLEHHMGGDTHQILTAIAMSSVKFLAAASAGSLRFWQRSEFSLPPKLCPPGLNQK